MATTSKTTPDDNTKQVYSQRSYQAEIVEQAKSENLIVCLPTGSGKTYIAVMLIKEWLPNIRKSFSNGGKRTILLVETPELARQHYETLKQVDLKISEIGIYHGSSKPDPQQWNKEFENHYILIFTSQMFLNVLTHNYFSLDKVNLLVFDECHHATGNAVYARIIRDHYKLCRNRPRILGLTASISTQKIEADKLPKVAKELENLFEARIETGSDRMEIHRNSTSVKTQYSRCINYKHKIDRNEKAVANIFKEIKVLFEGLDKYVQVKKSKNESENNPSNINNLSHFIQLQCQTLDQLKSHLDNIFNIANDLGLYGFSLAVQSLRKSLKTTNAFITIINPNEKELYDKITQKLDNLIEMHLTNLPDDPKILYSDKVLKVEKFIKENEAGQSIVFVDRVYTAVFLHEVLNHIFQRSFQIKYLAGSKANINGICVSAKYQRDVVQEFRKKNVKVLVATALIEEGFDVAACNLVIRFNKPNNFSSYIQSKGRARAKDTQALFVVLNDEHELDAFSKNRDEYENYEEMEKMLKRNFKTNGLEDTSDKDCTTLDPYRPERGVRIDGITAVQIVYQYCTVNGNGEILSPRFCFYINDNKFKCILSMPGNCPIREDVICENRNKKIAKQECCLKMIEQLHRIKELDSKCLPIRPEKNLSTNKSSDDEETERVTIETFDKQIAYFPVGDGNLATSWHLYRIKVSNDDDLGFLIPPSEILKLPKFILYGSDGEFIVQIIYVKSIDLKPYKHQLEIFSRYIFEKVFNNMVTESFLTFDIEHSTFKLLPCLLKKSDEIDCERMTLICERENKLIQNPSELNDNEVYYSPYSIDKQFYTNISDDSLSKHASDRWEHNKKPVETIKSYADHFENKTPNIRIQRDYLMATLTNFRKPRINYLNNSPQRKEQKSIISSDNTFYYPIELLRYAPLNRTDFELIYKLPSILVRISQLYYIEQMRKLLADSIQSYSLLDVEHMPNINFKDYIPNILTRSQSTALPLSSLTYDLLTSNCAFQPSVDILFQSITRHSTAEITDMENLEILGDCFLKLAMSMSLYHKHPSGSSGKLTSIKDGQVSNKNLRRLATGKDLKKYLYTNEITYGGKQANWLLPGYKVNEENSDRYLKQKAKLKAFADMMEGLIGAFLISTDYSTTIKFMDWLGLPVIPKDEQGQMMKTPSVLCPGLSDTMDEVNNLIQQLFSDLAFTEIETTIKYNFKNKAYLIAAFTHASYCNNRLTQCYERLEYLGDAILSFLVVRCIFVKHYDRVTPSHITDILQDLSNNGRLAYLLVSCDLHTKILHASPYLFSEIKIYLADDTLFSKENQSIPEKLSNDIDQWADSTAPKALADVFEALVGAIFLDSGYCLETVWKVIEPLLREYIKRSVDNPILNPVRKLFERYGKSVTHRESKDDNGTFNYYIQFSDGREIKGCGKNRKMAKYDACQQAIKIS